MTSNTPHKDSVNGSEESDRSEPLQRGQQASEDLHHRGGQYENRRDGHERRDIRLVQYPVRNPRAAQGAADHGEETDGCGHPERDIDQPVPTDDIDLPRFGNQLLGGDRQPEGTHRGDDERGRQRQRHATELLAAQVPGREQQRADVRNTANERADKRPAAAPQCRAQRRVAKRSGQDRPGTRHTDHSAPVITSAPRGIASRPGRQWRAT